MSKRSILREAKPLNRDSSDRHVSRRSAATASPTAKILVCGGIAVIDPPLPELCQDVTYTVTQFTTGGRTGHVAETVDGQLYTFDFRHRLGVPIGLLPRLIKRLKQLGFRVVVTDMRRFSKRHTVDPAILNAATEDRDLFQALKRRTRGQIEVRGLGDVVWRITQIATLFPRARIGVAVANGRQLYQLHQRLRWLLHEDVAVTGLGVLPRDSRVTVGTYGYLASIKAPRFEILLLADAEHALGEVAKESIAIRSQSAAFPLRVYAFVGGTRLDAAAELQLEAVAGPVIHRIEAAPVPVRVEILEPASQPPTDGVGLSNKRAAYWDNPRRNQAIAEVATALLKRDLPRLWQHGLLLNAEETPAARQQQRVTLLVESPEHGRRLLRLLPGWELRAESPSHTGGMDGNGTGCIQTLVYASRHGINADAVIYAIGGGKLTLPGFPPVAAPNKDGALLVDVCDDFDTRSRNDSQQRLAEYMARGWSIERHRHHGAPDNHHQNRAVRAAVTKHPATTTISTDATPSTNTGTQRNGVKPASTKAPVRRSKPMQPNPAIAGSRHTRETVGNAPSHPVAQLATRRNTARSSTPAPETGPTSPSPESEPVPPPRRNRRPGTISSSCSGAVVSIGTTADSGPITTGRSSNTTSGHGGGIGVTTEVHMQ